MSWPTPARIGRNRAETHKLARSTNINHILSGTGQTCFETYKVGPNSANLGDTARRNDDGLGTLIEKGLVISAARSLCTLCMVR